MSSNPSLSLSILYLEFYLVSSPTYPSNDSHLCPLKFRLIFLSYGPGLTLLGDRYIRSHKLFHVRKAGGVAMEAIAVFSIVGYLPDMPCETSKNKTHIFAGNVQILSSSVQFNLGALFKGAVLTMHRSTCSLIHSLVRCECCFRVRLEIIRIVLHCLVYHSCAH